uniref:Uncharacterized protein n=1 Tax=Anguilla anguilla TaxID=7936 RepID=A0A0E9SRP8_ANGAN
MTNQWTVFETSGNNEIISKCLMNYTLHSPT